LIADTVLIKVLLITVRAKLKVCDSDREFQERLKGCGTSPKSVGEKPYLNLKLQENLCYGFAHIKQVLLRW